MLRVAFHFVNGCDLKAVLITQGDDLRAAFTTPADRDETPDLVVFSPQPVSLSGELISRLGAELEGERNCAVQAEFVPDELLRTFHPLFIAETLALVSDDAITAFRYSDLVENLEQISDEIGPQPFASAISSLLNRAGQTSMRVPIPESAAPALSGKAHQLSGSGPLDDYFTEAAIFLQRNPKSFGSRFARQLSPHSPRSVLLDASGLPLAINGTSRLAVGLFQFVNTAIETGRIDWDVTVLTTAESVEHHATSFPTIRFTNVLGPSERFDLGVTVTPITSLERCTNLVNTCMKWVVLQLDIIAIRSLRHLSQQRFARSALEYTNQYADLVVSISETTRKDVADYLGAPLRARQTVCHLGVPDEFIAAEVNSRLEIDATRVLVLGNDDAHKKTRETVQVLSAAGLQTVSISSLPPSAPGHHTIRPGTLTDEDLKTLILGSLAVVFPSAYEGFGLPLLEVISSGKPIVCRKNDVNLELIDTFNLPNVFFYTNDDELVTAVQRASNTLVQPAQPIRLMSSFFNDFIDLLIRELEAQPDVKHGLSRWNVTRLITAGAEEAQENLRRHMIATGQTSVKRQMVDRMKRIFRGGSD